jgi:two-component system sensor histidine kinase KdpD
VELLDHVAPVLSLGVLYVFAVLPIAIVWGAAYAIPVAIGSMLAFNFLFLPPLYTFTLTDEENWVVLAVYLVTAVVVSELAARARNRAADAEQREREAAFLARTSAALLESVHVEDKLRVIAVDLARVLGTEAARIEIGSAPRPRDDEIGWDLVTGERRVGGLFLGRGGNLDDAIAGRVLPGLASVIAVAVDRERLAQRALEAETFRRSDEVKTAILRTVSHDLRSPLTAIRASVEALANATLELSATDRASLIETIALETKRLGRLVENLLDLSRLEVGAATPLQELHTLDDLVGRALGELGEGAGRVSVSFPEEMPVVRVDAVQIERVLVNVLENALKFSAGQVQLVAARAEDEVVIRVLDDGPGLTQEELGRIFEPFEHGRRGETSQGAGLGLAIARGFTQANGGVLWAEPNAGGGAVFVLSLPSPSTKASVLA